MMMTMRNVPGAERASTMATRMVSMAMIVESEGHTLYEESTHYERSSDPDSYLEIPVRCQNGAIQYRNLAVRTHRAWFGGGEDGLLCSLLCRCNELGKQSP